MGWICSLDPGTGGPGPLWVAPGHPHRKPSFFSEEAEREHWLTHCEILFLYLEVVNYFI